MVTKSLNLNAKKKINLNPLISLIAGILVVINIICYYPSLHFDFINLDDPKNLGRLTESTVFSQPLLSQIWSEPYLGHYQPLVPMIWWTLMPISSLNVSSSGYKAVPANSVVPENSILGLIGINALPFHALNLAVHSFNTILVFLLLILLEIPYFAAFVASLIFALHPTQAESVGWISVFGGLLCSCFILLSLICFIKYRKYLVPDKYGNILWLRKKSSYYWFAGALVSALAALLSKPLAMILPGMLFIINYGFFKLKLKRNLVDILPFCILNLFFIAPLSGAQDEDKMQFWVSYIDRFWIALDTLKFYIIRILSCSQNGYDYGRHPGWVLTQKGIYQELFLFLIGLIAISLGILYIVKLIDRSNANKSRLLLFLASGFFLLPLAPVFGFFRFYQQLVSTVTDRYLYLSMMGVAFFVGIIFKKVGEYCSEKLRIACLLVIGLLIVGPMSFQLRRQLSIWKNTVTLFESALASNPQSWLAYNNLGSYYEQHEKKELSIQNYLKSAELHYRSDPIFRAATMLAELGKFQEAKANFERILDQEPAHLMALQNLIYCNNHLGNKKNARPFLIKALQVRPNDPQILAFLQEVDN